MTVIDSQCSRCKRFNEKIQLVDGRAKFVCEAFPDGIPDSVFMNEADHSKPFPGDGGLQFVPIKSGDKAIVY